MKSRNKQQILRAIEAIQSGQEDFCCRALGYSGEPIREEFNEIFKPDVYSSFWTFFSNPDGSNVDPFPSIEEQIDIRLTALWLFYHMQ